MNVQADRTQDGSLSRVGWDDEGVPADSWLLIEKGLFKDYQTTREQVARIRSSPASRDRTAARSRVVERRPVSAHAERVAACPATQTSASTTSSRTPRAGCSIRNRGSWSIDHQRYNFQFSGRRSTKCATARLAGMLQDVAYQSNTPVFWNSMDMIGGKSSYWLGGAFNDGKGEPSQINSVSHGCVPARFRNVTILNTARTGVMAQNPRPVSDPTPTLLAREQAKELADHVLSMSMADQTRVNIGQPVERQHAICRRSITTSGGITDTTVTVTVTVGKRRASASTNIVEEGSLRRTVDLAIRLARLSPEDPELMPELGPQTYASVNAYVRGTADLDPETRAAAVQRAVGSATATGKPAGAIFSAASSKRPHARPSLRRATACSPITAAPNRSSR
jgi:predicted Zn-dependent protease